MIDVNCLAMISLGEKKKKKNRVYDASKRQKKILIKKKREEANRVCGFFFCIRLIDLFFSFVPFFSVDDVKVSFFGLLYFFTSFSDFVCSFFFCVCVCVFFTFLSR